MILCISGIREHDDIDRTVTRYISAFIRRDIDYNIGKYFTFSHILVTLLMQTLPAVGVIAILYTYYADSRIHSKKLL